VRPPARLALLILPATCGCDVGAPPVAAPDYSMAAPTAPVPAPRPAPRERCYGIAPAQRNDGRAPPDIRRDMGQIVADAGTATRDRQADAWVYVPHGACGARGGSLVPR
jgi:uncharacterized membrane protein